MTGSRNLGEHLHQGAEILVVSAMPEHARAAIAVERLEDDVLVLVAEGADFAQVRVIRVGGMNSANSVTNSFSGALRTAAGR